MVSMILGYLIVSVVFTFLFLKGLQYNINKNVDEAERCLNQFLLTNKPPTYDVQKAAETLLEYKPESKTLHAYAKRMGMDITPTQSNHFDA